jgi:hypothetical protein
MVVMMCTILTVIITPWRAQAVLGDTVGIPDEDTDAEARHLNLTLLYFLLAAWSWLSNWRL